jgi:hypothetical protein
MRHDSSLTTPLALIASTLVADPREMPPKCRRGQLLAAVLGGLSVSAPQSPLKSGPQRNFAKLVNRSFTWSLTAGNVN